MRELPIWQSSITNCETGFGRQLADELKSRYQDLAILRYSGYSREELLRSGAIKEDSDFIQKPFRADQFIASVNEALGPFLKRRRTAGGE